MDKNILNREQLHVNSFLFKNEEVIILKIEVKDKEKKKISLS